MAARSRSASASTIIGSLPPSSSDTGVSVSAARAMTFLPVAVEPVNMTMSTSSISAGAGLAEAGGDLEDALGQAALAQRRRPSAAR